MPFCDNLRRARRRAGLTQEQLAHALGLSVSAYCGYETGKRQPNLQRLASLAQLLHVSLEELLSLPQPLRAPSVSPRELDFVHKLRLLDTHGQRMLRLVLDEELSRLQQASEPEEDAVLFRLSEQPAAAGLGAYLGPDAFRMVRVRRQALPRGASFGVPVQGDSMLPKYRDGDILIVSDLLPDVGDVGVFIMDGAGYVKVMGDGELLSLNPSYAPIPMSESTRSCGKVVGILHPQDMYA